MIYSFYASAAKFHLITGYDNITLELRLRECYQAMPLAAVSETIGYILTLAMITAVSCMVEWRHPLTNNAFATSAISNKTAHAFTLFESLYTLKSSNDSW